MPTLKNKWNKAKALFNLALYLWNVEGRYNRLYNMTLNINGVSPTVSLSIEEQLMFEAINEILEPGLTYKEE